MFHVGKFPQITYRRSEEFCARCMIINFKLRVVRSLLKVITKVHPAEERNSCVYNADEALWVQVLKRNDPQKGCKGSF